jgi:hypothetical protein
MKTIQVFEHAELPLYRTNTEKFVDVLGGTLANDSYYRYYPSEHPRHELTRQLTEAGMVWDKKDKYFHVLIEVFW